VPSTTLDPITDNVGGPSTSKIVPVAEIVQALPQAKTPFWGLDSSTLKVSVFSSAPSALMSIAMVADRNPGGMPCGSVALVLAV